MAGRAHLAVTAVMAMAAFVLGLSAPPGGRSFAADLAPPTGPVILTVSGDIGTVNRGPVDPELDPILVYHEKSFAQAAELDRAMLESLGSHEIVLTYEKWSEDYRMAGPRLADLLSALGAQGHGITATALDGYAVELSAEELASRDWILALSRNGRPFGLGGLGPLWIVYAVPDRAVSEDDLGRWPWAVFLIEVQ